MNLKEALTSQAKKGDCFDRQRRIPDWNQEIIEKQICLVFGAGGVGCSTARNLCRLGVKKVILLDRDTVDEHNLNRQILFSKSHIGKSKAQSAAETLRNLHSIRTEVVAYDIDVLKEWKRVVQLAQECTVFFQGIDVGDYFDLACQALALKLAIPYCLAGTFQQMMTVDIFLAKGQPCWICTSDVVNSEVKAKLVPSKIQDYDHLNFLPYDDHPVGASCIYVCSTAVDMMVSLWVQHILGQDVPTRLIFYYNSYGIDKWDVPKNDECIFCSCSPQETPSNKN